MSAAGTPIAERWILIATGEGAASIVVSDLREGLHTFSCCCGKSLDVCRDETVLYILEEMNDPDNCSTDESGKPFQYRYDHECGSVTITRLDSWEELSASEERERVLREALEYCIVLDNLYVGNDFRVQPKGSDAAHLRNIWGQMIDYVESTLATPAPQQPAQTSAEKAGSK